MSVGCREQRPDPQTTCSPNEEPPLPGVRPRGGPGAPGLIGIFLITGPVLRSGLPHAHLRRESCVQSRLTCVVSAAFGASLRGAVLGVGRLPRATTGPAGNMFPQRGNPSPGVRPRGEPGALGRIGVFLITRPVLRSGLPHAHLHREACVPSRLTCVASAARQTRFKVWFGTCLSAS